MFVRSIATVALVVGIGAALAACGSGDESAASPPAAAEKAAPSASGPTLPNGIMLALAQFVTEGGKPKPGPARVEFLFQKNGKWEMTFIEDGDSNVFHKAMVYERGQGLELLTLAGTAAHVKTWQKKGGALEGTSHWSADFGGKFSRMRDAEVGDLYGDGKPSIAVATHDQGVVAILKPTGDSFEVVEIDKEPDTFVHEIEIGDLDGDGVLEVYATPSEPNRLDGTPQKGAVVRYVPKTGEGPVVVADLGNRHAKEILVEDLDGDGIDELYVSVEGDMGEGSKDRVEIKRYEAGTPPEGGVVIGSLDDKLTRFLTAGDIDGDGKKELVAAAYSSGLWLFRPGADPKSAWKKELIDRDSAGFEHAAILTDLDGDGLDELYVASDKHKQVRRYLWKNGRSSREVIYKRPDNRPIFTWNLMPVPVSLIPAANQAE